MKRTPSFPRRQIRSGADRIVAHVGARVLGDLADRVGLVAGLSAARAPLKQRRRGHDRGHVVTQWAVALADGATTLSDRAVLRHQPDLFGAGASTAPLWRTLTALTAAPLTRIAAARAAARRRVWAAGLDPGFYGIDIDGTLVTAHSDKEGAAPPYKRGYGFYPLVATLDATGEPLVALLCPGNAGSGTAADPMTVLDAALGQLPVDPHAQEVIVRTDSAGCSHDFLDYCTTQGVRFIVGHALTEALAVRMAEELGTSVIEEKGTRGTVPHPAVVGNSFGHRSTNEPGTCVIYPGSFSRCKRFWEQPRQHLGLASAEIFRRTPTPNPRPWGGLFCMSERYSWRLTDGMPVGRSEGKPH